MTVIIFKFYYKGSRKFLSTLYVVPFIETKPRFPICAVPPAPFREVRAAPLNLQLQGDLSEGDIENEDEEEIMPAKKKMALVFSFFGARQIQMHMIAFKYRREGYDCKVIETKIGDFINAYKALQFLNQEIMKKTFVEDGHYDIIHVMSGGFLQYGLLRYGGASISCDTIIFDSTPIMLKPASFVTFVKTYTNLPLPSWFIRMLISIWYWISASFYLLFNRKGKAKKALEMANLIRFGKYDTISEILLKSVLDHTGYIKPKQSIFVYNAEDPYINVSDIKNAIDFTVEKDTKVIKVVNSNKHIEMIFKNSNMFFKSFLN